ncbi:MAG: hypothetical protein LBJ64_02775 [Deltaproteobacteria bacterium]|nr:hypothetical protein [Deltaproteobacteria bacterium]
MRKSVGGLFALTAFAVLLTSAALAAQDLFVVKDMEWRRQDGNQLSDPPTPNGGVQTDAGMIFWLFADPNMSDEAKGADPGLYFYAENTGNYSFQPYSGNVNAVHFSPDGAMYVVEGEGEQEMNDVGLELFSFAEGKSLFKTAKAASPPEWIDVARFVYSGFESDTTRGRPDDYPDEWMSAYLFDAIAGEETELKKATATSDFSVGVLNEETGDTMTLSEDRSEIWLTETYVDSPADWADPEKAKMRNVTAPVPAAG